MALVIAEPQEGHVPEPRSPVPSVRLLVAQSTSCTAQSLQTTRWPQGSKTYLTAGRRGTLLESLAWRACPGTRSSSRSSSAPWPPCPRGAAAPSSCDLWAEGSDEADPAAERRPGTGSPFNIKGLALCPAMRRNLLTRSRLAMTLQRSCASNVNGTGLGLPRRLRLQFATFQLHFSCKRNII